MNNKIIDKKQNESTEGQINGFRTKLMVNTQFM